MDSSSFRCSYYERHDWLKVDVHELLAPWVERTSEIYGLKKKPAKYLVSYAFMLLAKQHQDVILHMALEAFNNPEKLQERYGSKLVPAPPNVELLSNPKGIRPPTPRQVNFMDIVDFWAKAINRNFEIGIVQCRDVVKIVFTMIFASYNSAIAEIIDFLVRTPDHELFRGEGKIEFGELEIIFDE